MEEDEQVYIMKQQSRVDDSVILGNTPEEKTLAAIFECGGRKSSSGKRDRRSAGKIKILIQ
ncbi:MAG TPA: hypothetical protein VFP71_00175 [Candidatus Angelobacter sp.]|nr:hypothetical protein [Candidatus Angelobacter sp.]